MAALKALVIVMGVMIVAGMIGLLYLLATRMTGGKPWTADLALPNGGVITSVAGVGNRLALHVTGSVEGETILFVDPDKGAVIGTLTVRSAPKP